MTKPKQELVAQSQQPMQAQAISVPQFSFQDIQRMAASFAKSGMYGIKDENQAFALMMEAQAQNKHPASIMRDYSMIGSTLSKKSTAMMRDFQASGGRIEWIELTDTRAAANFSHPLCPKPLMIDWDIPRAEKAQLVKPGGMYNKYTRAMLRSRCIAEGVRSTAPDAAEGMLTPEEAIAVHQEREAEQPAETITAAIEQTVTASTVEPGSVEWYMNSMDIDVAAPDAMAKLSDAFKAAWESTRDKPTREKYRGAYEGQKEEIAAVAKAAEPKEPQS